MLDLRSFVENPGAVKDTLKKRGMEEPLIPLVDEVVSLDLERRQVIQKVEHLKHQKNQTSQEIAKLKQKGGDATALLNQMKGVATEVKALDERGSEIEAKLKGLLFEFPNLLDASVPEGKTSDHNKEIRVWGKPPAFSFPAKTHDEIGEALGLLDFKKAAEVAGARFVFLKGIAAQLERALASYMLDTHRQHGYAEIAPPVLVNRDSLTGTGQLPKFEEDVFRIEKLDYFLIPTAEVSVTNYHRNEILDEKLLPIKYVAHTPCFRSEAGSYGKDTKGLKRQHQFNKVELVKFVRPEDSSKELETLLADAERILQGLKLPYRVVALCGGDVGFSSAKTYDLEVWYPGAKSYMEISSCSVFSDYQARRASIRYREHGSGKVRFVHTLNGSGLAVGRTLLAIMENFQKADGTFVVPECLRKYL